MKKSSGKYLFLMVVGALAGVATVGCGGDETGGTSGTGATAGTGGAGTGGAGTGGAGTSGAGGAGTGVDTAGTVANAGTGAAGLVGECVGTKEQCNVCRETAEGIYAMKVELDVWWRDEVNTKTGAGELADPGRGKLYVYFRGRIEDVGDDGNGKGIMHPCGTALPPFVASASCNAIQIEFPDTMWDNAAIPNYETTGMTSGFGVGDVLTIMKTSGLLGLNLAAGAEFPKSEETTTVGCAAGTGTLWTNGMAPTLAQAPCFPDHDGDGNPGVTVNFKNDKTEIVGPYACNSAETDPTKSKFTFYGAPLGLGSILAGPTTHAKQGWIGLQTELGGSGKIKEGCASGVGPATSGAGFPSRVLHCIQNGGAACGNQKNGDSEFLDVNTPNYHILQKGDVPPPEWKFAGVLNTAKDAKLDHSPSVGPRASVIRLGDAGSTFACDAIRKTAFLPFE